MLKLDYPQGKQQLETAMKSALIKLLGRINNNPSTWLLECVVVPRVLPTLDMTIGSFIIRHELKQYRVQ